MMNKQEDQPWIIVELLLDRVSDNDIFHLHSLLIDQMGRRGKGWWEKQWKGKEETLDTEIRRLREYQSTFEQVSRREMV